MSKQTSLRTRTYETEDGKGTAIGSNNQSMAGRVSNSEAARLLERCPNQASTHELQM